MKCAICTYVKELEHAAEIINPRRNPSVQTLQVYAAPRWWGWHLSGLKIQRSKTAQRELEQWLGLSDWKDHRRRRILSKQTISTRTGSREGNTFQWCHYRSCLWTICATSGIVSRYTGKAEGMFPAGACCADLYIWINPLCEWLYSSGSGGWVLPRKHYVLTI